MKEIEQVRLTKKQIIKAIETFFEGEEYNFGWADIYSNGIIEVDCNFDVETLADKILSYGR